ncbi:MAG: hypothetical protein ACYDDB_03405 [bacterium]
METQLSKNENIIKEVSLKTSCSPFIPQSGYTLTNKKVIAVYANTFLGIIPTGKNEITYPLNKIAGMRIDTNFSIWVLLLGIIFCIMGLSAFNYGPIFGVLLALVGVGFGILVILQAFKTLMVIQNSGGASISSGSKASGAQTIIKSDRNKAKDFINEVNNILAEQSE